MIQFKLLNQDNKTNEMFIQGSRANDTSNDIAALVFQNFDKDSSTIYNMAAISMRDQFGLSNVDGVGNLIFKTNINGSNLKEQMRLKHNGSLLINTQEEKSLLTVEGSLYSLSYCNMGSMFIGSNLTVNSNLYVNQNVTVSNTLSNLGNAFFASNVEINSNLFVNQNVTTSNTLSNLGNAYFASNVNINSNLYVNQNATISNTLSNLGNAFFASNVNINSNLLVNQNVTVSNTLSNLGNALFGSNVNIINTVTACNATLCNLNLSLLQMSGNILVNNNLIVMTYRASNTIPPADPSNLNLFVDEFGRLTAINSCNMVKIYNAMDKKGDLLTHSGIVDVILRRGSNNQFLMCDSNTTEGLVWKDLSTDTVIFDETESKYFHAYSSTTTTLSSASNTDIVFDAVRTRSPDFFDYASNSIIRILNPGLFYISAKVTTEASAGNAATGSYASLYFSSNQGSNFAEMSNTRIYQFNPSTTNPGSASALMTFMNLDRNSALKLQGIVYNGTNTIRTRQNSCEILIERIRIDQGNDNSKYADYIVESNLALTASFQDIPFFRTNYQDNATYSMSNGEFTVLEDGVYIIQGKVNTTSTVNRCSVVSKLLQTNSSNVFVDVPGTLFYNYMEQNTVGNGTGNFYTLLNLTTNTRLKLQSSILTGATATLTGLSEVTFRKFQSTVSGQQFLEFYSGYATSNILLSGAYTDILLPASNFIKNENFTVSNAEITVNETGRYFIASQVGIVNTTAAANSISTGGARMLVNTGNGFSEISGTTGLGYLSYSNAGYATIPLKTTQILQQGSKVKIQATRIAGTGTLTTLSNATAITMHKLEDIASIDNLLLKFGTYYQFASSLGVTTTTSTTYVEKLRLTTVSVPEGLYRIAISYQIADVNTTKDVSIRAQVDDTTIIHESRLIYNNSATQVHSDFDRVSLSQGIHNIDVDFRTNNASAAAGIQNVKIEFWRAE